MENDAWYSGTWLDIPIVNARHGRWRPGRRRVAVYAAASVSTVLVLLVGSLTLAARSAGGVDDAQPMTSVPTGASSMPGQEGSATAEAQAAAGTAPAPSAARKPGTRFVLVDVEAEAGAPAAVLTGSAQVVAAAGASGGEIVTGLGDWGEGQPAGTLQITMPSLANASTYRIDIYFMIGEPHGPRSAVVSVTGAEPTTVYFAGGPNCCGERSIQVALAAGPHIITITNATGMAPSIDKVVVTGD